METKTLTSAAEMQADWLAQSQRQDNKQHCDKIAQGFKKFKSNSAARAIWELIQNARDLARLNPATGLKECHIKITLTPTEFVFAHQGKSFTFDSLSSLVKQVSSQEKENDETVGQYGTGFLTTHTFGRRVLIDGSFNLLTGQPDTYVDINAFVMDREFEAIPEFIEKMTRQTTSIFGFRELPRVATPRTWTRLRYQLDSADDALRKAQEGVRAAIKVMPYVMTINDVIVYVEIEDQTDPLHVIFRQTASEAENGLNVKAISITENGETAVKKVYYLASEDGADIAILPLSDAHHAMSLRDIPKLFVFFPLLGTENFGMDFIFHSSRFSPVEERNGIYLPEDNEHTRKDYTSNVSTLRDMSRMAFDYLEAHAAEIDGLVDVCRLTFKTEGNEDPMTDRFFEEMKQEWSERYLSYPMVPTAAGRKSVGSEEVRVLDRDIAATADDAGLDVVYDFGLRVSMLPDMSEALRWTENVYSWLDDPRDYTVTLEDIAAEVSEDSDLATLHALLEFIVKSERQDLFKSYALLPNREGQLCRSGFLVDAQQVSAPLYRAASAIVGSATAKMVHEEFADLVDLTEYTRKDLSRDINDRISKYDRDHIGCGHPYEHDMLMALMRWCSFFNSLPSDSMRSRVMPLFAQYYGIEWTPAAVAPVQGDDGDIYRTPFEHLVEATLVQIAREAPDWVEANLALLHDIIDCIYRSDLFTNSRNGIGGKYAIYPNLRHELCKADELSLNEDADAELLDIAGRALGRDYDALIVNPDFRNFFDFDVLTAKSLAKEIEDEYADKGCLPSDIMLEIIDHLDRGIWEGEFKYFAENKAKLFFEQVQGSSRDSIYKIMKADEDKLALLAQLADEDKLDEILDLGRRAMEEQQQREADFQFKYAFGKHIEDALRTHLAEHLSGSVSVDVTDCQNGQDIVVLSDGEPVYYVEIKSKRSFHDGPAHMSRNQMRRAVDNPDRYALCCVDLTGMPKSDAFYPTVEEAVANTYVHLQIADELRPIMAGIAEADDRDPEATISMGGDYCCNIPKRVFISGTPFSSLIQAICERL